MVAFSCLQFRAPGLDAQREQTEALLRKNLPLARLCQGRVKAPRLLGSRALFQMKNAYLGLI